MSQPSKRLLLLASLLVLTCALGIGIMLSDFRFYNALQLLRMLPALIVTQRFTT
jgi:hypothetical protein